MSKGATLHFRVLISRIYNSRIKKYKVLFENLRFSSKVFCFLVTDCMKINKRWYFQNFK